MKVAYLRRNGTPTSDQTTMTAHIARHEDILAIMGRALDHVGVAWRFNRPNTISIARRTAVQLLDEHIGPKS